MTDSGRRIVRSARGLAVAIGIIGLVLAARSPAWGDVAATGSFGIDVSVPPPFTSGTFDGEITGFNAGPFTVGGTTVNLATGITQMNIINGNIPQINLQSLAATFDFDADDENLTANSLSFEGAGRAICTDLATCSQGQGTFVADVSNIVDPQDLLPDGYVYTFDGTVAVDPGPFDAAGRFGLNASCRSTSRPASPSRRPATPNSSTAARTRCATSWSI